jgi:hypothetical protein
MFPRRFYPGRYFAPRFFPESDGDAPVLPTANYGRVVRGLPPKRVVRGNPPRRVVR